MKDGRIVSHGEAEEILSAELLDEVYDFDVAKQMKQQLRRWESIP